MTSPRQWKARTILALLLAAALCLNAELQSLHPIAARIESSLLDTAPTSFIESLSRSFAYYLWMTSKAFVLPALIIAFTYFLETWLSEAQREPKNQLMATLVQLSFFYLAYLGAHFVSALVPMPSGSLLRLPQHPWGITTLLVAIGTGAIFLVAYDFLLYWTHRAHHYVPFLWKFHAVHHSTRDLDALHNYTHPVEQVVRYLVVGVPLNLLLQLDEQEFYLILTFLSVQTQLSHMNAPLHFGILGNVLVDNRHHFVHHSSEPRHFNRNYALIFSFTDRIFGTYCRPGPTLPKTGFDKEEIPSTMAGFILARKVRPQSTVPKYRSSNRFI